MKLILEKNQINGLPEQFLRRAGYGFIRDRVRGKESFVRRLGNYHYPRLHMYVMYQGEKIVLELHLDQKQASYAGADHMHNAEYDGPVVGAEIERLRNLVAGGAPDVNTGSPWDNLRRNVPVEEESNSEEKKEGWIKRFFS